MKMSRRKAMKLLALAAPAISLPRAYGQAGDAAEAAAQSAGAVPSTAPATAAATTLLMRPIPPAPAAIAAPAGFGVSQGPFQPTWESLAGQHQVPDWYRDAKFGIWAH